MGRPGGALPKEPGAIASRKGYEKVPTVVVAVEMGRIKGVGGSDAKQRGPY